jgi:cyclopropane-fatty-acyl-phospholipid synthase
MALPAQPIPNFAPVESLGFLDDLFANVPNRDFQVRFWDGTIWGSEHSPTFTIVLKHPGALRRMFHDASELSLGEAYIYDDFDLEGDIEAAMELGEALVQSESSLSRRLHLAWGLRKLPNGDHRGLSYSAQLSGPVHSPSRDRQAIAYHYNLPTEFYAQFLDQRLVYSCAYFKTREDDLDTAQVQKLDYICRKLRLRPGERLLDIGCGWGALVLHAAKEFGARALGITLSEPQAEVARTRIAAAGLTDRCQVEVRDYRDFDNTPEYDKIVSVGMFEHVGENLLSEYFRRAWNLLKPGGTFLNHGIAYSATYKRKGESFVEKYVFPDGELVPIHVALRAAEACGFEIRDVESLREHYALTLRHWVRRLEQHADQARHIASDIVYRIWRLYMAGSAYGFRSGRLNLYQVLLAKPSHGEAGLPLTRADWYGAR